MRNVVVAPQPPAAETGAAVFAAGGSVYDAAVAAAFVQAATDPLMCGVGGFGVAQVFDPQRGEHYVLQFFGAVGSRFRPDQWAGRVYESSSGKQLVEGFANQLGYQSILVPGTVAGLAALHRRGGRLPWHDLLQPAIRLLRTGFPLYSYISDYFYDTHQYPPADYAPPFAEYAAATPAMARLWLDAAGRPLHVGAWLTNPEYAATLERLALAGPQDFYSGELAQQIAADLAAHNAFVTAADLAGYQPTIHPPLTSDYRGYTVATNPLGGVTLLQILNIVAGYPLSELGHNTPAYLDRLASAMRVTFSERGDYPADPQQLFELLPRLSSNAYAAELRARMEAGAATQPAPAAPGTTHLTVAGSDGSVIALTHTLGLGSGVVTDGLGFQYNNGMHGFDPRADQPSAAAVGRTRPTAMTPTIVFADGEPHLALGSPGSNAIINAIAQVILNRLEFGMSAADAVAAPRVHCEGGPLMVETRLPSSTLQALEASGHVLKRRPFAYDSLQGRVQLIVRDGADWYGASDPRRDGGIAAYV